MEHLQSEEPFSSDPYFSKKFESSVNAIPTKGADYAHHITACPPGFEKLRSLRYQPWFAQSSIVYELELETIQDDEIMKFQGNSRGIYQCAGRQFSLQL